jgi:short-subunit dehydrogenase
MKVAVITGASRGIGYELSCALAARDVMVIAIATTKEHLKKLQNEYPDNIHIITADVCSPSDREKIFKEVAKFQKIDFFVNNAAIITPLDSLKNVTQDEFTKILTTNVIAPIMLVNQFIPYLKNGRVLDMSSPAAYLPIAGLGPYNITKAASYMVTNLHRIELKPYNISVTSVLPGEVDTFMHERLRAANHPIATEFQQAKAKGTLMSPKVSAAFLTWLLLDTSIGEYESQKWSIYDEEYRNRWLKKGMVLPLPIRKEQRAFESKTETDDNNTMIKARL